MSGTGKKLAAKSAAINDENGVLISEIEEVKLRWKKYIEDLYSKSNKPKLEDLDLENECEVDGDQRGPDLLSEEIYAGIMEMKDGKAVGVDDVPAEFLKMLDGRTMEKLIDLCKQYLQDRNLARRFHENNNDTNSEERECNIMW